MMFIQYHNAVPVDIKYSVKIICNRMRELNTFNKNVLQTFSSRQAYTFIKGQYVPIIMDNVTDNSVMDLDKRKYYVQSYEFTMLGYLIDEEEFQVKPAVSRVLELFEVDASWVELKEQNLHHQIQTNFHLIFSTHQVTPL